MDGQTDRHRAIAYCCAGKNLTVANRSRVIAATVEFCVIVR